MLQLGFGEGVFICHRVGAMIIGLDRTRLSPLQLESCDLCRHKSKMDEYISCERVN